MAVAEPPVLDRLLDPIRECLTKDVAAKVAALRADAGTQAKLDEFVEKNKEGTLSAQERSQYDTMFQAGAMIAVLQAKARSVLNDGNRDGQGHARSNSAARRRSLRILPHSPRTRTLLHLPRKPQPKRR